MEMVREQGARWRKLAVHAAVGAIMGGVGAFGLARLLESGTLGDVGGSELAAALVGLVYAIVALQVAVGVTSPRLGARFLNVEDIDELREQRAMLARAAASMAATGGLLMVLALAGPGRALAAGPALIAALVLALGATLAGIAQWRRMDELMRSLANEAGNLGYYLLLVVGGGWAMLAHLGFVGAPAALDWVTMLLGLVLVASFVAVGRRGMLKTR